MTKLFKYLKQSWVAIFTILILLALQATTELSLPTYTSNIVNVGIQQSGIENATIKAIRESEMNKLTTFMNDSDKEKVLDNYKLVNKDNLSKEEFNNYKKEYPVIKKESLYVLSTKDKDTIDKLSNILSKPMLIVYNMENSSDNKLTESMMLKVTGQNNMSANMDKSQMAKFMDDNGDFDIFAYINAMPKEQKKEMLSQIDEHFFNLPDAMLGQGAIKFVKAEYKAMGVDIDSIQMNYIFVTGLKMIGITIISVICSITVGFIAARVAATLGKNLRAMTFKKVMNFSKKEISEFSTASLITRSTNDIQQIQQMMVMMLRMVFFAPFMAIGGIIKALSTNLSMSWIIGLGVVCVFGIVLVMFTVVMPKFKILQNLVDRLNLVTREILTGLGVIRAFSNEKFEEDRFDVANKDLTKVNMFVNRMMSCMMPAMMLIMNLISILIVWVGAKNIDLGNMQVGDMMAFIQYTMQIVMSFLMISMVSVMMPRAAVSANRIDEVLTTDISIKEIDKVEEFNDNKKGLVEFKNVYKKYGNTDALKGIDIKIPKGKIVGLLGPNGSGKTTMIKIMNGLLTTTEGEVLINGMKPGIETKKIVSYLPERTYLNDWMKVKDIIDFFKDFYEDFDEVKALQMLRTLEIDENRRLKTLSKGTKEKVQLILVMARKADLYILDEPIGGVDPAARSFILDTILKNFDENSTLLIATHLISEIENICDEVIFLSYGEIALQGNVDEIREEKGKSIDALFREEFRC